MVRLIATGSADVANSETHFEVDLARGYIPGSLIVELDGDSVPVDSAGVRALVMPATLTVPASSGRHRVMLHARFMTIRGRETRSRRFSYFVPMPIKPETKGLISSWPTQGTKNLSRGEAIQLEFASPPSKDLESTFSLTCGGRRIRFVTHHVHSTYWLLNPRGLLPAKARCIFEWLDEGSVRRFAFTTAAAGDVAIVEYDREIEGLSSPFPDDYFTRADRGSPTRKRIDLPKSEARSSLDRFAKKLESDVNMLDGFSSLGHVFVALSDAVDPSSLPHGLEESVHPASSIQLIDIDPRSPTFGGRLPFVVEPREDLDANGSRQHSLLVFPSLPSRPGGRMAVVLTRALRASPERPFAPSSFMHRVFQTRNGGDSKAVDRARNQSRSALWVVENILHPPIPREDMALIVSFTTGTLDGLSRDLLQMRSRIRELPLPAFSIDRIDRGTHDVSAIVHGIWHAPKWRDGDNVSRDEHGHPVVIGFEAVPFTLALPRIAKEGGAPIVIYQHGNPGNAETEVPIEARRSLASAGFAVLGFTDIFNRELAPSADDGISIMTQLAESLLALDRNERLPDYWLVNYAEQLAFLRLIEALEGLDVAPLAQPDGKPDLDLEAPMAYVGISEGASHAPAFLAYAPEIRSAVLVAGGAPIAETLTHQIDLSFAPEQSQVLMGDGRDLWLGLSLLQTAIDRQDAFQHARLLYREPVSIDGDLRRASVLLVAGLEDSRIPNRYTDALAWLLGPIPMLEPTPRSVGFLPTAKTPITANVNPTTTSAYVQVVPAGLAGLDVESGCDPSMMNALIAEEGHYCAQVSPATIEQRLQFFLSALKGEAPVVSN